jgi:heterodisulfide reductase subunit A-like polyferredoxin
MEMTEGKGDPDIFNQGIPRVAKNLAVKYARVPGVHIIVMRDRCVGCGACVKKGFCRFGAISVTDRTVSIDERRCRGCSRCTHLCPRDAFAIEVRPHPMVRSALRHIDNRITKLLK